MAPPVYLIWDFVKYPLSRALTNTGLVHETDVGVSVGFCLGGIIALGLKFPHCHCVRVS